MRPGIVVVATLAALLAGCASEIELGEAHPSGSSIQVPTGARVHPEEWPDACRFLTDAEIRGLLPNTEAVRRTPEKVTLLDPDLLSGDNLTGDAPHGSCDYQADHGDDTGVKITVAISSVGLPADVRSAFERERAGALENKTEYDTVKSVTIEGATGCFRHGSTDNPQVSCHKGNLAFEVETWASELADVPFEETGLVLHEQLQPEIVKLIVGKLA
jgi:hypothetical protein